MRKIGLPKLQSVAKTQFEKRAKKKKKKKKRKKELTRSSNFHGSASRTKRGT